MIQSNATHRDGQRGYVGAADANGFALFESETGARFTVAACEVIYFDESPAIARSIKHNQSEWPTGCLTFKWDAPRQFSVTRTPTASQCNAKRSAANQARLADAQRRADAS